MKNKITYIKAKNHNVSLNAAQIVKQKNGNERRDKDTHHKTE